jgi:hypothetical protein
VEIFGKCLWCGTEFSTKYHGGFPMKFCSKMCRKALEYANRKFITRAVSLGLLTVDEIKQGPAKTFRARALNRRPIEPFSMFTGRSSVAANRPWRRVDKM